MKESIKILFSSILAILTFAGCDDDDNNTIGLESDAKSTFHCGALDTDYSPENPGQVWQDKFAEQGQNCVSEDGEYVRIEQSISTIARVTAFESIADLLFDPTQSASTDAFMNARQIYQEDEGLDSRLVRRYDPHFSVPDDVDCAEEQAVVNYPGYCVGPSTLQPITLNALNAGIEGTDPRVQAGRIEAALLWFFYASQYKESLTCTEAAKDCDSAYAYVTGGQVDTVDDTPKGLGRYIRQSSTEQYTDVWNGILAVRCWRDLDSAEIAEDEQLRDTARDQYDNATLQGLIQIIQDRIQTAMDTEDASELDYHWAFLQTIIPALDVAAEAENKEDADALQELAAMESPGMDTLSDIDSVMDRLFGCN